MAGGKNATYCVSLSVIGKIAHQFWLEIPAHFPFVSLDEFVIMPNHVHGILIINHSDDATGLDNESVVVETLHATSLQQQSSQP